MDPTTVNALLAVNYQFYQTFAPQFSATRQRIQPGVQRLLPELCAARRLLDLGCGNGELTRKLIKQKFVGQYVGLDFSPGLLAAAAQDLPSGAAITYLPANLAHAGWEAALPSGSFDLVVAFAVLHHIPGAALRRQILCATRHLLVSGGRLILSNWQFLNSPRLRQRIQPWEQVGFSLKQVDPGDYLLDWRHGGRGLRYAHHFSVEELAQLAHECSFEVIESFLSDGENGQSGLYQIWQTKP